MGKGKSGQKQWNMISWEMKRTFFSCLPGVTNRKASCQIIKREKGYVGLKV